MCKGLSDTIEEDRPVPTLEGKEVKHPPRVWQDASYANYPLEKIRQYFADYAKARGMSPGTIRKYDASFLHFLRSLSANGVELTLANLHPVHVNRWISEQRAAHKAEDGIATRLSALKAISRKYIYKDREMTTIDLLEKVPRINPPAKQFDKLSEQEQESILSCFGKGYVDTRNKAFMACLLATGRRFREILELKVEDVDLISGEIIVRAKGGDIQSAYLCGESMKMLKKYLRMRPDDTSYSNLWLSDEGTPWTYWGAQRMIQRLKPKCGVKRLHAHLFRHNFAQHSLEEGVERATLQEMLGHKTEAMTRRYAGAVGQQTAAKLMPKYSPLKKKP